MDATDLHEICTDAHDGVIARDPSRPLVSIRFEECAEHVWSEKYSVDRRPEEALQETDSKTRARLTLLYDKLRPLQGREKELQDAIGRTLLMARVRDAMDKGVIGDKCRPAVLTGDAGMGKSTIAVSIVRELQKKCHVAAHFCRGLRGETTDPVRVICSLAYQLAESMGGRMLDLVEAAAGSLAVLRDDAGQVDMLGVMESLSVGDEDNMLRGRAESKGRVALGQLGEEEREKQMAVDIEDAFRELLMRPLTEVLSGDCDPVTLVVDAVDEGAQWRGGRAKNAVLEHVVQRLGELPGKVRALVTTRGGIGTVDEWVEKEVEREQVVAMELGSDEVMGDVRKFLRHMVERMEEDGAATMREEAAVEWMAEKSEGVMAYAEALVKLASKEGGMSDTVLSRLPKSLDGLYGDYMRSQKERFGGDGSGWWERVVMGRAVVALVGDVNAIKKKDLRWIIGEGGDLASEEECGRVIEALGGLFQEQDGCIVPFHESLVQWLRGGDSGGEFGVDGEGVEGLYRSRMEEGMRAGVNSRDGLRVAAEAGCRLGALMVKKNGGYTGAAER